MSGKFYSPPSDADSNLKVFNTLEAPLILGVAVVGLLVGCALYHMCYQKVCQRNRNLRNFRNRGLSTSEIRANSAAVSALFQTNVNGRNQRLATDEPPRYSSNYEGLLPNYSEALKYPSKRKDSNSQYSRASIVSSTISEEPPAYEESKENSPTSQCQV